MQPTTAPRSSPSTVGVARVVDHVTPSVYLAIAVALCSIAAALIGDAPHTASLFLWGGALAVTLCLYKGRQPEL